MLISSHEFNDENSYDFANFSRRCGRWLELREAGLKAGRPAGACPARGAGRPAPGTGAGRVRREGGMEMKR